MKSVIQEASSIAKAIELALTQAAHPKDFSVKILEHPTKNFFGITTRPARIALYWDDKATQKTNEPHPIPTLDRSNETRDRHERGGERNASDRPARPERREQASRPERREQREPRNNESREPRETRESRDVREREPKELREPKRQSQAPVVEQEQDQQAEEPRVPLWNAEMVDYSKRWLQRVLTGLQRETPFTLEPQQFYLRIVFPRPLFDDADQERKVLASLSLLLLETCRHTFKVNLRGHKVLLTHEPASASSQ